MDSCQPQFPLSDLKDVIEDSRDIDIKSHAYSETMNEEKPMRRKPLHSISSPEPMFGFFLYCLDCLVSLVLAILVIPIVLLVLYVLKFGRWVLLTYIRYKYNCIPLEDDDAVWQQDSATNRHIIHALMILEGQPDVEKLKKLVCERLVFKVDDNGERVCSRLTQAVKECCGQFVWQEEENFDINDHFAVWEGDLPKNKDELEDVIAELGPLPFRRNLSPWKFHIIPTKYEKPSYCFLLRIHHSIGDGVGLTRVFVKYMYDSPPVGREPRKFSTKQRMYMWCKAMLMGPSLVVKKFFTSADVSAVHGQELSGLKTASWSQDVSLALVKEVKNATGTTVNDVMVSCIAGALHDYLETRGSTVEDMCASVPVDIRATEQSLKAGNKFALVFMKLPIKVNGCLERLYEAKKRMDVIKTSAEPLITSTTVTMLMALPQWFSCPLIDFFSCKMSCVLSNIPGPLELLSIGGQQVYEGLFFPPMRANIGIGLSIFSYGGKIRIGVLSDKNIISNPREITAGFNKHFNHLVSTLQIDDQKKHE
ncbi:uncharacterized protein LOC116286978 isoform X1 [Actinia tenebrosa]|uniref:Uncharacterized protein LOC116286978 isoform X1 n=2 Tax=Actinia tenebrosa TaxID=6105 RepID=A0A6P8H190_ACTTE|nr:uncharacterized protein LOC116286978 isoform X1 [Actinia tenebrosa]